jgi:hypothetical protein
MIRITVKHSTGDVAVFTGDDIEYFISEDDFFGPGYILVIVNEFDLLAIFWSWDNVTMSTITPGSIVEETEVHPVEEEEE